VIQQPGAELLLQPEDLPAQRRLGDVQSLASELR